MTGEGDSWRRQNVSHQRDSVRGRLPFVRPLVPGCVPPANKVAGAGTSKSCQGREVVDALTSGRNSAADVAEPKPARAPNKAQPGQSDDSCFAEDRGDQVTPETSRFGMQERLQHA
jgi:hypothetical protein